MSRNDERAQRKALDALAAQLDLAELRGHPHPCRDRLALWTSETADERAQAVEACAHCWAPLLAACGVAGEFERFGVWGGVDRTRGGR